MASDDRDFYAVVGRRRSVRKFGDRPVEREKLVRIIEAGLRAPSYNHLREWHFILLSDPLKRQAVLDLGDAFSRAPEKKFLDGVLEKTTDPYQREAYTYSVPLQERMILTAPELVVACFRMEKPLGECETLFSLNNVASVWMAVENILLAMAAEGLFGVTMVPFRTSGVKGLLGIPGDYEVAAFIPLGYPEKEPSIRQVRIDVETRIHRDAW
jgi:nitroreductase